MDHPNVIQLILTDNWQVDTEKARCICPPKGVIVVEMLPELDRMKGLELPDTVKGNLRPDVGVVLAAGIDVSLNLGELVAVDGYQGQWVEDFSVTNPAGGPPLYETKRQVRFLGRFCEFQYGETIPIAWDECVLCKIDPETKEITAVGTNLIVKRQPLVEKQGSIDLAWDAQYRTGFAEVVMIGPDCITDPSEAPMYRGQQVLMTRNGPIKVGDLVHYNSKGEREFAFEADKELVVIPDLAVNFVVAREDIESPRELVEA